MSYLINPSNSVSVAPTINTIGINSTINIPGSTFTLLTADQVLNTYYVIVIGWEYTSNSTLSSLTWGGESVTIRTQTTVTQGANVGGVAICTIRNKTATISSAAMIATFSNNVSAVCCGYNSVENNSSDTPYSTGTATKNSSGTQLFIGTNIPTLSATLVIQTNIVNGATSTLAYNLPPVPSPPTITKNVDSAIQSKFQFMVASMRNDSLTNYQDPTVRITSLLSSAAAATITFI
jgi:hypothetical protein